MDPEVAFVWDDNFITKLVSVDDQHHELVDLFNELHATLLGDHRHDDAVLQDVYDRLIGYTQYHFADEEALMRSSGVDERHIQMHHQLHAQFVSQVGLLWAQRKNMQDMATTLVGYLTSWLGLHILGVDQSMARQMNAIAAGTPADQAYEQERQNHDNSTQVLLKMIGKLYTTLSVQNIQLSQANSLLEERVAQRTRELELANAQLAQRSRTDGLLGIANRAYLDERLALACAHSQRSGRPLGLLMIDVDFFKRYNDRYGHQQGDECLKAVARALCASVQRETDLVARYGGEELAMVLPDTDAAGLQHIAQQVVDNVRALALAHAGSECSTVVTVSVGGISTIPSLSPGGANASAQLVAQADAALYRVKKQGRNGWLLIGDQAGTVASSSAAA